MKVAGATLVYEGACRTTDIVACTADAKQCPDGSYVGRTGPNCEFEKCPAVTPEDEIDTPTSTPTGELE